MIREMVYRPYFRLRVLGDLLLLLLTITVLIGILLGLGLRGGPVLQKLLYPLTANFCAYAAPDDWPRDKLRPDFATPVGAFREWVRVRLAKPCAEVMNPLERDKDPAFDSGKPTPVAPVAPPARTPIR